MDGDEALQYGSADDHDALAPEELRLGEESFIKAVQGFLPLQDSVGFNEIIAALDRVAEPLLGADRSKESVRQALAKLHGDWFEWLLCLITYEVEEQFTTPYRAVRLPNVTRFDAAELYQIGLAQMLQQLRTEVRRAGVELITSNPDFALIRREAFLPNQSAPPFSQACIDWHVNRFRFAIGECDFEAIKGFLAAKYTLRPDRRLQMSHEGSLMKALYVHLQTRLWITAPPGLLFYAVASKVGPADIKGLKTVATHSITTVASRPQAAVDQIFETKTIGQARAMFRQILGERT